MKDYCFEGCVTHDDDVTSGDPLICFADTVQELCKEIAQYIESDPACFKFGVDVVMHANIADFCYSGTIVAHYGKNGLLYTASDGVRSLLGEIRNVSRKRMLEIIRGE